MKPISFFMSLLIMTAMSMLWSCEEDSLTQADCERITDPAKCNATRESSTRTCHWQGGRMNYVHCGDPCDADIPFEGCFLSDSTIEEQLGFVYHREVGENYYQVFYVNSWFGNLTGWKNGAPECVPCETVRP
mgnify:CR=1 FL=1